MGLFEQFILNEAAPPAQQQPDQQQAQPTNPNGINPPDEPPDLTQQQSDGDTSGTQAAPDAQQGGDPSADPNAQQDPNAAGAADDPNMQGDQQQLQGPPSPNDQIQQAEQNTFSDLKPEQMDIKVRELKTQYKILHDNILKSLEKINKVSHTTYDDTMLDFIVRKLVSLKNITRDALNDTFATRTYVENKFEFQRLVLIFNLIANMLSEIYKSRIKRRDKIDEMNQKTVKQYDKSPNLIPGLYRRKDPDI